MRVNPARPPPQGWYTVYRQSLSLASSLWSAVDEPEPRAQALARVVLEGARWFASHDGDDPSSRWAAFDQDLRLQVRDEVGAWALG
jgi:hypothetical protein